MKKVLVVAAHPDDEVLGCGGTMALLNEAGHEVYVYILGEGATSRDLRRDPEGRRDEIEGLRRAARKAGEILGVRQVYFEGLPDNRFDSLDLLDLVKKIESRMAEISPQWVFTHFSGDLNQDHALLSRAVHIAVRPLPGSPVRRFYAFETPSSTEWTPGYRFSPSVYFDISGVLERKMAALRAYEAELREFPHPRSPEAVEQLARLRGAESGFPAAEAFALIRARETLSLLSESRPSGVHLRLAEEMIRRHEGLRLKPYRDTMGKLTIGYGRNLEDRGISEKEALDLLRNDLRLAEEDLREVLGEVYEVLSPRRKAVLLDMMFNLGRPRFLEFKRMIAALKEGDFEKAAAEMLDSRWAGQVGRRSRELAALMREG